MKNALTRTIIVCVAVNLMTAGFVLAQNAADEEKQASKEALIAEKETELLLHSLAVETAAKVAQKEAEAAAKVAQQAQKETELERIQKQLNQLLDPNAQNQAARRQIPEPPVPPVAQKEAYEVARRQMESEMMMMALPEASLVNMPVWQYSGGGTVLVIPTAQMKTEDLAAITEDMAVMSRIFDKKLSQAHLITVRSSWSIGIDPRSFGRSSGAIEAIYLEGYGALFLMKVNALLSPPPEALEEKETEEEDADPLWTQMRQEIYAPEEADKRLRRRTARPEEKYDAEKVKELKETLIKTLKHAANIRNLKPDESVILTVIGKAGQSATRTTTRSYDPLGRTLSDLSGRRRSSRSFMLLRPVGDETGFSSPTVLTIRAKKSDIDAFAKGQLTFDQFRQKTQLLSYSYLGENVGGPSRSSPTRMSDYMSEMMMREE